MLDLNFDLNTAWNDAFDPFGFLQEINNGKQKEESFDEFLLSLADIEDLDDVCFPEVTNENYLEEQHTIDTQSPMVQALSPQPTFIDDSSHLSTSTSSNTDTNIAYNMDWCLKTGKTKSQQFWAYCEGSQNNFAKFSLVIPGMNITPKSNLMRNIDGSVLYIVEDTTKEVLRAVPVSGECTIKEFKKTELKKISPDEVEFDAKLVEDRDEPVHPHQGPSNIVHFKIQKVAKNYKDKLNSPLGFMLQVNFTGRSEGWFKILISISYKGNVIAETFSKTFMLNNPRMKKLKEHKLFTAKQLKFMQVYSLCKNTKQQPYWINLCNEQNLDFEVISKNATTLFPVQNTRKRAISKKRRLASQNTPNPKRQRIH